MVSKEAKGMFKNQTAINHKKFQIQNWCPNSRKEIRNNFEMGHTI